jgi:hypothetical protein
MTTLLYAGFLHMHDGIQGGGAGQRHVLCRKLVSDMIYESHFLQNIVWKAKQHEKVQKQEMRNLRLTPEQYMEVNMLNSFS